LNDTSQLLSVANKLDRKTSWDIERHFPTRLEWLLGDGLKTSWDIERHFPTSLSISVTKARRLVGILNDTSQQLKVGDVLLLKTSWDIERHFPTLVPTQARTLED